MMAKLTDKLPEGELWTYELKWDGYRALLLKDHTRLQLRSRERQQSHDHVPNDSRCRAEAQS